MMMFGTKEGNEVIMGLPREVAKAMRKKSPAERFDHLFALTFCINDYPHWIHDNECWEPGGEWCRQSSQGACGRLKPASSPSTAPDYVLQQSAKKNQCNSL